MQDSMKNKYIKMRLGGCLMIRKRISKKLSLLLDITGQTHQFFIGLCLLVDTSRTYKNNINYQFGLALENG